ncbi:MAG: transposase [Lutibacter sp.]|nr:transposase [Lutibacter sp.]
MRYRRLFLENTYVFLTVVTSKRRPILIDNIELLKKSINNAKRFHDFEIFGIVILPEHFHIIIKPKCINNYPKIVHLIKTYFSKNIDINKIKNYKISPSRQKKQEKDIWQRRYWEHTIRDENDLYNHLDYIHFNPVKHNYVNAVKDWKYSSFEKFVKRKNYEINWGNFKDILHIQEMDLD